MHYPWWYVPYLTAPMLIAVISVVHVLVSHYAVGGGLFLAVEVGHARRTRDSEYLNYLRGHARFFVLLTVVFGAITGVGIWWTIGLTSPLATEVLIRTFVFGWATEWVFFVVELVAAFIFLYYWDRLPREDARRHRLDLRPGGLDQPGVDHRHHGLHAQPGRLGLPRRLAELLGGVFQPAIPAADDRPHRRRAAAEFALRLSARLAEGPQRAAARHDRVAFGAAGHARGGPDHRRRHRLVRLPAGYRLRRRSPRPPCSTC